jgi:hypothetical protein
MTTTKYFSVRVLPVVLVTLLGAISGVASFQSPAQRFQNRQPMVLAAAESASATSMATLTEATTWTMRMNLDNLQTEKGKKTDGIFVVQTKFTEEEGYEPPQGNVLQVFPENDTAGDEKNTDDEAEKTSSPSTSQMTIKTGRWTLSEDPNDRKDSLWYVRYYI